MIVSKDAYAKRLRRGWSEEQARETPAGVRLKLRHGHAKGHGSALTRSLTYNSWRAMKQRCLDPEHKWYHIYGKRGITICERWLGPTGFANFLADVGERPDKDYTIDRYPNNDGNYEKDNCRWATKAEQVHNSGVCK